MVKHKLKAAKIQQSEAKLKELNDWFRRSQSRTTGSKQEAMFLKTGHAHSQITGVFSQNLKPVIYHERRSRERSPVKTPDLASNPTPDLDLCGCLSG